MTEVPPPKNTSNWNVPNTLSFARFALAMVVFGLIEGNAMLAAMICFIIAASTDWVDGWWARKYNQVTKLGRILDPFVDKIIICGTMIALCAQPNSPIAPWMATLVVGRELLVTSLRGMVEGKGGDFSAKQLGKWKMVAQCAAVVATMLQFQFPAPWLQTTSLLLIWAAIALTIISGVQYVMLVIKPTP